MELFMDLRLTLNFLMFLEDSINVELFSLISNFLKDLIFNIEEENNNNAMMKSTIINRRRKTNNPNNKSRKAKRRDKKLKSLLKKEKD